MSRVNFLALAEAMSRDYPYNAGVLAEWMHASPKSAPDEPLTQQLLDFMGTPETFPNGVTLPGHYGRTAIARYLFVMAGQEVVPSTMNFKQFWYEIYKTWYATATPAELSTVLTSKGSAANEPLHAKQIKRVATHNPFIEGAQAFLTKYGFESSLTGDHHNNDGCNSLHVWATIYYNALKFGGQDLWQAITEANK